MKKLFALALLALVVVSTTAEARWRRYGYSRPYYSRAYWGGGYPYYGYGYGYPYYGPRAGVSLGVGPFGFGLGF